MCKLKKVRDESKPQWVGGKKKEDFPEITGKVRTKREDRWFVPGFKLLPLYQDKGTPEQENFFVPSRGNANLITALLVEFESSQDANWQPASRFLSLKFRRKR